MGSVDFIKDGYVATISFNRPEKLNTMTKQMTKQLVDAVYEANHDEDIRVVVLTGVGDRAFSAGSDITLLDEYHTNWEFRNRLEYCDVVRQLRKPLIAMVNGFAVGGGLELALCADIRFAGKSAKFGAVEVKLGWIGGGGITQLLTHLIGYGKAMKLILSGDIIDADEANQIGLIEAFVSDNELETFTYNYAHQIASYSPIALQTAKHGCRMALSIPLEQGIMYERDMQTICFYTEDRNEGIAAFKEKRKPIFKGR
ncbi:enoyl-CoA hydratase/isomerase family protein [Alkalihalobacillus oceani]|uniref:Enoyl-CoA hydratase/isomerase family protein n=1 Tax=Halalkalibacter oceani TaxID=1653776 RepID=A0A9X2DW42_9BACI|nr:enoyl-CoA hydratase/isomerase family protein [Halalkalibacter oceani]MCM3716308.1 enoyl-CoA hydratase/isomerase family protein [Halalkalibacter oceani]